MCFPKNKRGKPIVATVKASSARATPTQKRVVDSFAPSQKKIASAPAKGPEQHHQTASHVEPDSSNKEKTCIEDKSDAMQISLYKAKKKDAGSDSGGHVSKPPVEEKQDSPEVFENNAQVVSLNPINVTQIFVDSVIPQTNVSKQHTDIVDQNTLETVQNTYMDDMVYDRLDSSEEQFPEVPQPRPRANVLQPEDDTIVDNTMSERATKPSEKRATRNAAPRTASSGIPSEKRAMRTAARATVFPEHPTTPDRIPSVFTPQPPTKSEKVVYTTGKRLSRGPISTRTAAISRPRPSGARTPPAADHVNVDNTCPSHEPLTNRAHRHTGPQTAKAAPATEYGRTTMVQTATPIAPAENTITGSREPCDSTATAKKTVQPGPPTGATSAIYTAHFKDP